MNIIFLKYLFFSFKKNMYIYFVLIKNNDIDAKWDKASISKTYNEKKEKEKIKERKIFFISLNFSKIFINDKNAKKFIIERKILNEKLIKKMSNNLKFKNKESK